MLHIEGVSKYFRINQGLFQHRLLKAVENVSLQIGRGQTVGLVGESGSGKTTLGRCVARLHRADAGRITLDGKDLLSMSEAEFKGYRRLVQMVFQDPSESLNPRLTIGQTLAEPLRNGLGLTATAELRSHMAELLHTVGLDETFASRYPHQLSGGQQQRIGIARALASKPQVVVLDEPTSALDVSVRGHILNLLVDLQAESEAAYLFISHDLATVRYVSQEVVVMYLGQVVERGPTAEVFQRPQHPYTRALFASAPTLTGMSDREHAIRLSGEVGNVMAVGPGCPLAPRCPLAQASCHTTPQRLVEVSPGHQAACHVVTGS